MGLAKELPELSENMLQAKLKKLNLVTREDFDIQAELLAQTTIRLKELENRLDALAEKNNKKSTG